MKELASYNKDSAIVQVLVLGCGYWKEPTSASASTSTTAVATQLHHDEHEVRLFEATTTTATAAAGSISMASSRDLASETNKGSGVVTINPWHQDKGETKRTVNQSLSTCTSASSSFTSDGHDHEQKAIERLASSSLSSPPLSSSSSVLLFSPQSSQPLLSSQFHTFSVTTLPQWKMAVHLSEPDQYGQRHPIESPQLFQAKLLEMHYHLHQMVEKDKAALLLAEERCPELLTPEFQLMFLRCDVYQAKLAAKRYACYWDRRLQMFGMDYAFRPLSIDNMIQRDPDEWKVLQSGLFTILTIAGRPVLLTRAACMDLPSFDRMRNLRVYWYMIHAYLEHDIVQRMGSVSINCMKNATMIDRSGNTFRSSAAMIRGALPIRMSVYYICFPPPFVGTLFRAFRWLMPGWFKKRVHMIPHDTDSAVMQYLESNGLPQQDLPVEVGGTVVVDHVGWVESRRAAGK